MFLTWSWAALQEQTLAFKLMRTINPAARKPEEQEIFQTTPKCSKAAPGMGWGGGTAFRASLGGFGKERLQPVHSSGMSEHWEQLLARAEPSCALGTAPGDGWAVVALGLQKL